MKKLVSILALAIMVAFGATAQTSAQLISQQNDLNKVLQQSLNAKPTKEAKRQAKELRREGWIVNAGCRSIENQIMDSHRLSAELMVDEYNNTTHRFIQHTAMSTAETYNAAFSAARANAQGEIAAMLETEIAAALQVALDNSEQNSLNAVSVDKFNQRLRGIVNQSMNNSYTVVQLYRRLPNNNFEVQVRIVYDKQDVANRIKNKMRQELETEGNELYEVINNGICNICNI